MSKAKSFKKTIVVAAAAGMMITTSIGTVSAGQIYSDSTVGISSAFDRYANTLAGNDKNAGDAAKAATSTDAQKTTASVGKNAAEAKKDKTSEENKVKYPDFKDKCLVATEDYVNIRSGAGTDSDVVGIIGNNGIATIEKKGKEWTKVTSGDCTGYIRNDLLLFGDDAGAYAEANCPKQVTVNTETLNVRTEADVNSDCITQVGSGQSFDVISQDDKWVQIALDDETNGYVSTEFVDDTYAFATAKSMEQIQAELDAKAAEEKAAEEQARQEQESADEAEAEDASDDSQSTEDDSYTPDQPDTDSADQSSDTSDDTSSDSSDSDDSQNNVVAPSGQTGIDLANFATQFVGNPYVYGGSSLTDGADCSGFVMAVYAQFGYSLPHSAGAQSQYGTRVDTSSLEPGDILFYGDSSIEHCAIYIGDGMIVHASTEETGIKISSAFYRAPLCAVRIIGQ